MNATIDPYPPKLEGRTPGDTYAAYRSRCQIWGLVPEDFTTWMRFEVEVAEPARHAHGCAPPRLDVQQRLERTRDSATVCPTVAKS